jgi:hypothetical protein
MTVLELMIRRARVKMKMVVNNQVHHNERRYQSYDYVCDNTGIRFIAESMFDQTGCAVVRILDYADETQRTIDSVLLSESAVESVVTYD